MKNFGLSNSDINDYLESIGINTKKGFSSKKSEDYLNILVIGPNFYDFIVKMLYPQQNIDEYTKYAEVSYYVEYLSNKLDISPIEITIFLNLRSDTQFDSEILTDDITNPYKT